MVPINDLTNKLIKKEFADENGKPKFVGKFLFLSDYEIVCKYNSIFRGWLNFENMAENRLKLRVVNYNLEYSLAHTLGAKHKMSLSQSIKILRKPIGLMIKIDTKTKTRTKTKKVI